jgi:hypothetical protein
MEKDGIVSATLAEIYLEQGYLEKAILIYDKLLVKEPDNEIYRAKRPSRRRINPPFSEELYAIKTGDRQ